MTVRGERTDLISKLPIAALPPANSIESMQFPGSDPPRLPSNQGKSLFALLLCSESCDIMEE